MVPCVLDVILDTNVQFSLFKTVHANKLRKFLTDEPTALVHRRVPLSLVSAIPAGEANRGWSSERYGYSHIGCSTLHAFVYSDALRALEGPRKAGRNPVLQMGYLLLRESAGSGLTKAEFLCEQFSVSISWCPRRVGNNVRCSKVA